MKSTKTIPILPKRLVVVAAAGLCTLSMASALRAIGEDPAPPTPPALLGKLDPQMREVIQAIDDAKTPPIYKLSPEKARKEPSASDAAKIVAKKRGMAVKPEEVGDRDKIKVAGKDGKLDAVLFRPEGNKGKDNVTLPVLVYFHGGGWVIADIKTYEASCRALANAANCVVISVAYRQAPEYKYPAAAEDAYAATQYIIKNSAELNIDSKRVAVGGESAGGNLATVVCLMAKDRQGAMPIHQLLVYPVTEHVFDKPSYEENGQIKPLVKEMMPWFWNHYLPEGNNGLEPYASPLRATDLKGLPPATVITAEFDVLRDEGEAYAKKLQDAGVPVTAKRFDGVTHEFFGMAMVLDKAKEAENLAAAELRKAFGDETAPKQ